MCGQAFADPREPEDPEVHGITVIAITPAQGATLPEIRLPYNVQSADDVLWTLLNNIDPERDSRIVSGPTGPVLAHTRRVVAPDLLGFGYTERPTDPANPPEGTQYRMEVWVRQATFAPCRITR